jgi:phosphocarrier protein
MKSIKVKIIDPVGLHARPAAVVVKEANNYDSDIIIKANGKQGNLKSIMNVMSMAVKTQEEVVIEATGKDEQLAIDAIEKVMKTNKLVE